MNIFKKTISDEEWLTQVKPLYEETIPVADALDKLIANAPLPDDGDKTLKDALEKLYLIAESLKKSPKPTSPEASQAKIDLEFAIKSYAKGTKEGLAFYRGMAGKLGDIYRSGVGLNKLAGGTLGGILSNFINHINSAQNIMKRASAYFSPI